MRKTKDFPRFAQSSPERRRPMTLKNKAFSVNMRLTAHLRVNAFI
jgi:hypothetical protein